MDAKPTPPNTWVAKVTTFNSLQDAWEQVCSISAAERGNLSTPRRNKTVINLKCKHLDCPFNFYVSYDKKRAVYLLRRLNLDHHCTGRGQEGRGTVNSVSFVEKKVCASKKYCFPSLINQSDQSRNDSDSRHHSEADSGMVSRELGTYTIPHCLEGSGKHPRRHRY